MGTSWTKYLYLLGISMCIQSCVSELFWEGKNVQVQPQVDSQTNTVGKPVLLAQLRRKGIK